MAELKARLSELRSEELNEGEEAPLVTEEDVGDVLGAVDVDATEIESSIIKVLPTGYIKIIDPPKDDFELDPAKPSAQAQIVGKKILWKWEGFGWCLGSILRRNGDPRRKVLISLPLAASHLPNMAPP